MDWKLEGSAQKTDSHVLQEQEVILEDTGEDSISESFRLLQIDVECEHREGDMLPTGGTVWCSVSVAWLWALGSCFVPETPRIRVGPSNKKARNEFGMFQNWMNFPLTGLRFQFHLSPKKSRSSSRGIFDTFTLGTSHLFLGSPLSLNIIQSIFFSFFFDTNLLFLS